MFVVNVTATDPSDSVGTVMVTINVDEVNEGPGITRSITDSPDNTADVDAGNQFIVTTPEEVRLDLGDITGRTDFSILPVFNGYDVDSDEADITWSLSGADAKRFDIANIGVTTTAIDHDGDGDGDDATPNVNVARAALRWSTSDGKGPSFEAMDSADGDNVYLVTVTASDGSASTPQDVSITVVNTEERGSISLTQRVPQEGIAITARLSDQDGSIRETEWQWYRGEDALGVDAAGDVVILADGAITAGTNEVTPSGAIRTIAENTVAYPTNVIAVTSCTPATGDASTTCSIDGATSSTYIPKRADATSGPVVNDDDPPTSQKLTVVARYVDALTTDVLPVSTGDPDPDGDGTDDGDIAIRTSESVATVRPNENDLPSFGDDESVSRSVAENVKGASVGDPVTATDKDLLIYALSGDGSDDFAVDEGQITTAKELDFETRSSYTLTLTATDPSLASGSIVVNITVTDTDDPATISAGTSVDYAENGTGPVQTFVLNDQDASSGGWSVSGADAALFEISSDGALSFKSSPNYESPADTGGDNTYNVTVSRSGGSLDVAVNVTNVDEAGSVEP